MGDKTEIQWTDATWNPTVGCSLVSPGCTHCYAMKQAHRLEAMGQQKYAGLTQVVNGNPVWNGTVRLGEHALTQPLRWKRPRKIFVNSMSDLFHESLSDEQIDHVFAVMALAPQHTFQVLTKRAERLAAYFQRAGIESREARIVDVAERLGGVVFDPRGSEHHLYPGAVTAGDVAHRRRWPGWPLPNVWLGVSVEDQRRADERIPHLLRVPAAVRFLSCEPLLGPVNLAQVGMREREDGASLWTDGLRGLAMACSDQGAADWELPGRIGWVIAGGESGPGARPMHPDWARGLRDECQAAGVAFHFKQHGAWLHASQQRADGMNGQMYQAGQEAFGGHANAGFDWPDGSRSHRVGKHSAGRLLDGRTWDEFPEVAR